MQNKEMSVAVKSRLKALFKIIQEEAERNPVFYKAIEQVLLSEEMVLKLVNKRSKSSNTLSIDMAKILYEDGLGKLSQVLDEFTTDQLIKFGVKERAIKSIAEGKKIECRGVIDAIVNIADLNNRKGSVFSKSDEK